MILTPIGVEATGMDGDFDQVFVELAWGDHVVQTGFGVRRVNTRSAILFYQELDLSCSLELYRKNLLLEVGVVLPLRRIAPKAHGESSFCFN